MTAADLDLATGNVVNPVLLTLNPANAATLTSVPMAQFIPALAVRPEDGVIFGTNGDQHQLFTVDPVAGALTLIGDTGSTFIGDLAFQTPLVVGPGQCVPFPFNFPSPAGAGGTRITITSSNPSIAIVDLGVNPTLFVLPGATTDRRTPAVCGVNFGTAIITVTDEQTITQPVLVTATLNFYPPSVTGVIGRQIRPTLLLSAPAPGNLTVTITSDNPAIAAVPASVVIPANATGVTVPVTPVGSGVTIVHASAPNLAETTLIVTVR